jgi:hypothetical protein
VLQNGDRDGELERARLEKGMRSARHGDDKTGPQSLKSEVRVGPIGCLSLGADVCALHVFLLQHGSTHAPRPRLPTLRLQTGKA